jgi:hypothetical protein
MLTFLFWNIAKQPLQDRVARIVAAHGVDVLMLAECAVDVSECLAAINRGNASRYGRPFSLGKKVQILTRLSEDQLVEQFLDPSEGVTVRRLSAPGHREILLVAVHLPSRINWDREDQLLRVSQLVSDIQRFEKEAGHSRTVLVGDLNMNPFDAGMSGVGAFHGVMSRDIAGRETRKVLGRDYPFFYNPMWGLFGDRTPGPAGSYYFRSSKPVNYFWNMYDQVLLRPELMDGLRDLQILDSDGTEPLLTASRQPDSTNGSDHLPILFQLDW